MSAGTERRQQRYKLGRKFRLQPHRSRQQGGLQDSALAERGDAPPMAQHPAALDTLNRSAGGAGEPDGAVDVCPKPRRPAGAVTPGTSGPSPDLPPGAATWSRYSRRFVPGPRVGLYRTAPAKGKCSANRGVPYSPFME